MGATPEVPTAFEEEVQARIERADLCNVGEAQAAV